MVCAMLTTWILNVTHVIPAETNLISKELLEERVKSGWYSVIAAVAAKISGAIAILLGSYFVDTVRQPRKQCIAVQS